MRGDCQNCGHAIGYHHGGTAPDALCTVKDCDCPGYRDEALENPRTGPITSHKEA